MKVFCFLLLAIRGKSETQLSVGECKYEPAPPVAARGNYIVRLLHVGGTARDSRVVTDIVLCCVGVACLVINT